MFYDWNLVGCGDWLCEAHGKSIRLERVWRDMALESGVLIPRRTAFKAHQFPDLLPDLTVGNFTRGLCPARRHFPAYGKRNRAGLYLKLEVTLQPILSGGGEAGYAVALSVPASDKGATPFLGQPVVVDWSGPIDWIDLGTGIPEVGDAASMSR